MKPGPRRIIELDGLPRERWSLREDAVHLWRGRLWALERVGRLLCVDSDDVDHATLSSAVADAVEWVCLAHGRLIPTPYIMEKRYVVTIGGHVRTGYEEVSDFLLLPASMPAKKRSAIIEQLLDEMEHEEKESDAD